MPNTVAQDNEEWINKLADKLKGAFESTTIRFDSDRSAQILFSLVLNTQKETELKPVIKTKIKEIYKLIGDFTITSAQRIELLKILLESNMTDDEIRYIIKELQLYLFVSNQKDTFDKALLYKMWNIQEEIAVLINLRDCANSVSVDIDRVIDRIGEESLTQMIKFQKHNACNSENWTECFECIVSNQGLCENASFENSERIWGDGSEHGKLFVIDRKNNVSFREPVESDTNGYSILGRTYLKLIVDTIQQHQNKERIDNSNEVRQEFNEIDTLVTRFKANFKDVENILYKRSDSSSLHLYFMEVGRASLLQALESRDIVPYHQTKRLLPFWRYAMASCPELGYRDMIVSELYTIINREGK